MSDVIELDYEGQKVQLDAEAMVKVESNIHEALMNLPDNYLKVSKYLAYMKKLRELEDVAYNEYWSKRYRELKGGAYEQLYMKKATENSVEYALNEDPTCVNHKKRLATLQEIIDRLFGLLHDLDLKLEVLKELGSHLRQQTRLRENA